MTRRHTRAINDAQSPKEWRDVRDRVVDRLASGFLIALLGPRGPGKTQIAQQVLLNANVTGRMGKYTRAMTFFLELRETYTQEDQSELSIIQRYQEPALLIIDEMQERGETPWEDRMLNHLIDLRYGDMTDTLLIANLTPAAFQQSMGASICDRLRETGGLVECKWASFREKSLADSGSLRSTEYREYLKSDTWKALRESALLESGGKCVRCGDDAALVHHAKYPETFGTESVADLEPLCNKCHKGEHGLTAQPPRREE